MGIFAKNKDFFGLDIGTTGIRVVQLAGGTVKPNLMRFGSIKVDSKMVQSNAPGDQGKLAKTIKKLVTDSGIKSTSVVIGVPSKQVYSSVIETAQLTPQELGKSINYLAEKYIPVPIDQVKLDWAQLGPSPVEPTKQEVLLLSVRNIFTESRLDMLGSIGLDVVSVQPEALASGRSLLPTGSIEPVLVLDLGANTSDLSIFVNGAPRLIRSISVGGNTFVKSVMQGLGVDEEQAAQFVFKFGLNQQKLEGQIYDAIHPGLQSLIEEVNKSIQFFVNRYKGSKISKIIVTGQTSSVPELPLYLVNQTQTAVEIGNSWTNVNYPSNTTEKLMSASTEFSVAVGLAEASI
ncbi:type IV pilus assembly protein PilM [Candidatus Saccharibacteria bacterium]|jgi:type IV pilus assembly protein PilM|nr:type IV pilus assembly protein PilM [Candidatus Saccharibacteria bacterium]MBP9131506.1 type IV pilus assembly protein PilM [Candidatus Saccharibacteria bacterium]